jgi:hypothetical protein
MCAIFEVNQESVQVFLEIQDLLRELVASLTSTFYVSPARISCSMRSSGKLVSAAQITPSTPVTLWDRVIILPGTHSRKVPDQQSAVEYLLAENRVIRKKLGKKRFLHNDGQRRRLARSSGGRCSPSYGCE